MKNNKGVSGSSRLLNSFQQRLEKFRMSNSTGKTNDSKVMNKSSFIRKSDFQNEKPLTPNSNLRKSPVIKGNDKEKNPDFFAKKRKLFGSLDQNKENETQKTPVSALLKKSNYVKRNTDTGFLNPRPCSSDTRFAKSYRYNKKNPKVKNLLIKIFSLAKFKTRYK